MNKTLRPLAFVVVTVLVAAAVAFAGAQGGATWQGLPVIVICAALAFIVQWIVFIPSYKYQTEHYYDLTGSLTYLAVVTLALLTGTSAMIEGFDSRSLLLTVLVYVWALRLGPFLFRRIQDAGKDARFDKIKVFWPRFLVTWTLQGLWVFLTLAAALAAMTTAAPQEPGLYAALGTIIWMIGFTIETIADAQKTAFNKNPNHKGKFINIGLWRWSQHPNYFGEITLWFGVAIIAFPVLQGWQLVTLISPLFVYLLLTRISGIPLLAKRAQEKFGDDPAYAAYRASTSLLFPLPPKNS